MAVSFQVSPTASLCGFEAKFIDVNGIRTRYYDVGQGEPMVLCHGHGWDGSASANAWTLNIDGLSKHFRVLAADKLGSGMTDNPKTADGFTIQNQVAHKPEHLTPDYVDTAVWLEAQPKAQETKQRWKAGGEALFNRTLAEQKEETLRWLAEGRLQIPTLVFWGRKDPSAILECRLKLYDLIAERNPRAHMYIISDAGHFHFREYPEEFNRVVTSFVTSW